MNEDFIPFELAKRLKEKGFPQRVFGTYEMYGAAYFNDGRLYRDGCICHKDEAYTAPTISQVLKWLREEKKILITIIPQEKNLGHDTLCFGVYRITEDLYQPIHNGTTNTLVDSYEYTALAGIEYVIDNLI